MDVNFEPASVPSLIAIPSEWMPFSWMSPVRMATESMSTVARDSGTPSGLIPVFVCAHPSWIFICRAGTVTSTPRDTDSLAAFSGSFLSPVDLVWPLARPAV